MFKQVILPLLAVIAFIVIVGLFIQKSTPIALPQKTITIGTTKVNVQISDTEEKRVKGLSGVTSLDAGRGMLFVFGPKGVAPVFWMKDMKIPLDIIWIGNGKVVRIDKNIPSPVPGTPDTDLKTYSAGAPIDYVLEVNAGFSDKNGLKVGDPTILPTP